MPPDPRCPAILPLRYAVPPCTVACELPQGHAGMHRSRAVPAPYDEVRWPSNEGPNPPPPATEAPDAPTQPPA